MITKQIDINGSTFRITLTEQTISQVNHLKKLYAEAYEDPESFERVSSEISDTINEIAAAAEPEVSGDDLDGLIQEVIRTVEKAEEELENQGKKSTSSKKK